MLVLSKKRTVKKNRLSQARHTIEHHKFGGENYHEINQPTKNMETKMANLLLKKLAFYQHRLPR